LEQCDGEAEQLPLAQAAPDSANSWAGILWLAVAQPVSNRHPHITAPYNPIEIRFIALSLFIESVPSD